MIQIHSFVPMAFFKKEIYTGSRKGMRYWVKKDQEEFLAVVYPEPYCYEATPEEKKTAARFPFTEEGRGQVVDWLNEQYDSRRPEWDRAARR